MLKLLSIPPYTGFCSAQELIPALETCQKNPCRMPSSEDCLAIEILVLDIDQDRVSMTLSCFDYCFFLLSRIPAKPAKPVPKSSIVAGTGTGAKKPRISPPVNVEE
jgi:hypothetical protein